MVQVELDTGAAARRLRNQISELFGQALDIQVIPADAPRPGSRYLVQVVRDGESLARQTGLLDRLGRPVRGLPPHVVSGGVCDAEAAWRGAFLAHGSLTDPGRAPALEITSPGPEAALALVGAARRLGVPAKTRQVRGVDQVVVRDEDTIVALLTRLGAPARHWPGNNTDCVAPCEPQSASPPRSPMQQHRIAQAAAEMVARVQRALEMLGEDIPEHLLVAGRLRVEHHQASLAELGQLADPPITKDAIAGRIRRLLVLGNNHAHHQQAPDTTAPNMLELTRHQRWRRRGRCGPGQFVQDGQRVEVDLGQAGQVEIIVASPVNTRHRCAVRPRPGSGTASPTSFHSLGEASREVRMCRSGALSLRCGASAIHATPIRSDPRAPNLTRSNRLRRT